MNYDDLDDLTNYPNALKRHSCNLTVLIILPSEQEQECIINQINKRLIAFSDIQDVWTQSIK